MASSWTRCISLVNLHHTIFENDSWTVYVSTLVSLLPIKHVEAVIKWPPFCRRYFEMNILFNRFCTSIQTWLKFGTSGPMDNKPALVPIMAQWQAGDKPLFVLTMTLFIMFTSLGLDEFNPYLVWHMWSTFNHISPLPYDIAGCMSIYVFELYSSIDYDVLESSLGC